VPDKTRREPILVQRFISFTHATASRFPPPSPLPLPPQREQKSIKAFITLRNALRDRVLPRFFVYVDPRVRRS